VWLALPIGQPADCCVVGHSRNLSREHQAGTAPTLDEVIERDISAAIHVR